MKSLFIKTKTDDFINSLVSIIMPVHNGASYISEAIQSVLKQTYEHWELLIVNDGSTDNSEEIIYRFIDNRIRYFKQDNKGVSSARNAGLGQMRGLFFCFLDADDVLPKNSLTSRLSIFQKYPDVSFVDGYVQYVDESLKTLNKSYRPTYKGDPFNRLIKLDSHCYFGNTWMIKRDGRVNYEFATNMSHAEDLFFYLSISQGRLYNYTNETTLLYRQSSKSAMQNIQGLEDGYIQLIKNIKSNPHLTGWKVWNLKLLVTKIIVLSFIFDAKNLLAATKAPFKILTA